MAFHEVRFPPSLSFGASGGPERLVEIVTLANGFEERNAPWAQARRRYDAGLGLCSLDDLSQLIAFFEARGGQLHGFRWKDWSDWASCLPSTRPGPEDQLIARGDEATTVFPLRKAYVSGGVTAWRPIAKPVLGTVLVAVGGTPQREGVDWTVDPATGLLTFALAPDVAAEVTAGFEFDVPVRFDTAQIRVQVSSFRAGEAPSVPVVEVRS